MSAASNAASGCRDRYVLDLSAATPSALDRRLAIALGVAMDALQALDD